MEKNSSVKRHLVKYDTVYGSPLLSAKGCRPQKSLLSLPSYHARQLFSQQIHILQMMFNKLLITVINCIHAVENG